MLVSIALIAVGFVLLGLGGDALVRGASSLALLARVPPAVVGLTVVAAGTSMPELAVSVRAALGGSSDLALGNVVGSNIINIGLILSVAALIRPLTIVGNTVRLEWPIMFLAACQLHLLARDGTIDRLEGGFLLAALVAFVAYNVRIARRAATPEEASQLEEVGTPIGGSGPRAWGLSAGAVVVGCAVLVGGAQLLVAGAVDLATAAGVSERVIGLTIVAFGTSLPELAASGTAAWRGHDDIAVANVVGSNIFNVLGIIGATAVIQPVAAHLDIITRDNWWMLGVSLLLLPIMYTGMRITRLEAVVLLATTGAWLWTLV